MKDIIVVPGLMRPESCNLNTESSHSDDYSRNDPLAVFPVNFRRVNRRRQKGEGSAARYHREIPDRLNRRTLKVSGKAMKGSARKSGDGLS